MVLKNLFELGISEEANPVTKAIVHDKVTDLRVLLSLEMNEEADSKYGVYLIDQYLDDPAKFKIEMAPSPPPGSPIGNDIQHYCEF